MTKEERKLAEQVREKFGVELPKWRSGGKNRAARRVFSKAEHAEMDAIMEWLMQDREYMGLCTVYNQYCGILAARGFGTREDHAVDVQSFARNFARCQVEYIYHDMACDPEGILKGEQEGYWLYLDRAYQDVDHMRVGDAIINLDEVWAVVSGTLKEWHEKGNAREAHFLRHGGYTCDRCGKVIYSTDASRFDKYENLLHGAECAHICSCHWRNLDKWRAEDGR